jgi:hypothetical protein
MLPADGTEDEHLAVLGLLNSSTACFWMKQVSHQKQMTGGDGVRVASRAQVPYEFAGTQLQHLPIPESFNQGTLRDRLLRLTRRMDELAQELGSLSASRAIREGLSGGESRISDVYALFQQKRVAIRSQLIVLQEEIDFTVYVMFGLADEGLFCNQWEWPEVWVEAGQRPFELLQQRNVDDFPVSNGIPAQWPEPLRSLWRKRMDAIKKSKDLRLIEDDHYKRRWIGRQGLFNQAARQDELKAACENWLLDRLEEKRYWPRVELQSTAQLADHASSDAEFMQVAALYRGRPDFDLAVLVGELVEGESVPFLPILRYKASGQRKREVWERTWDLQRQEDERVKRRKVIDDKMRQIRTRITKLFEGEFATLKRMEGKFKEEAIKVRDKFAPKVEVESDWSGSAIVDALRNERLKNEGGVAFKSLLETAKEISDFKQAMQKNISQKTSEDAEYQTAEKEREAIPGDPEIPVPSKYVTADFQKTDYWRLRGKLDVPKERWISYPHCEFVSDPALVVGWAGWNHLEQATALVTYYDARKREGWDAKRITPLLAGLHQLLPWIHQWHPEIDKEFGETAGKSYQSMLEQDAHELGLTLEDIRTWQPPVTTARRRTRK